MAVPRPVTGNTAATLASIQALCDAADAAAAQLAGLEQALASDQAAIGAETRARQEANAQEARARGDADAAEAKARQAGLAAEAEARADALERERQQRARAVSDAVEDLRGRIVNLGDDLREALRAESRARTSADGAEQAARADGIRMQAAALAEAVRTLEAQLATKAAVADLTGVATTLASQRLDFVPAPGRPGDAPLRYTRVPEAAALRGARAALPILPAALIAAGENGPVVRQAGSGILAARQAFALEPGRLYRARYVVQRRTNPSDPTGDAVVCGVVYLDQSLRVLGDLAPLRSYPALVTAHGRQECEALIARSPGLGAAFQAPASARFAVPAVAAFGPDAVTDIEVLGFDDVTGAFVLAPPPDGLEARLAILVAGLAARVEVLEREAGTPGKLTFGSRGDAAHARIPDGVQVVELLGRAYAGDGGAGLYARVPADPPAGADSFTAHGAVFQRVRVLPDVAAALIEVGFEPFVAGLPTEPPDGAGRRWNDRGVPAVTR